jgi:4-methyl-5(b-hydroxyethyl)-thiazole monophosphate biosynthesis
MARVLIPLAQGCEELEAVTVIDLLRRAGIEVVTAGLDDKPVKASRGVVLIPDTVLSSQVSADEFDMMVLPGGLPGADHLNDDPRIHQLAKMLLAQDKHVAAICAAPKILMTAGVLKGKKATCYPGSVAPDPSCELVDESVVVDQNVVTSRGPGTAMDFALTLIEILVGKQQRLQVEAGLMRS